jgi:asparagine synthetase B (glutamine-hydrolysing)
MCGILYSQTPNGFSDLEMLKRRGPEGFQELKNDLGYFAHSMLNTIGEYTPQPYSTKLGIFLYNGSTYNSGEKNDTKWIADNLDDNLDHTLSVLRELNGEYALIYVTEKNVVFCVDHFDQRNLWFYHSKASQEITIASLPNVVKQKHNAAWRVEGNRLYVLDRNDFSLSVHTNKEWNLEQSINNFDNVFEEFEKAVKHRHTPNITTTLLSSGIDSGVIACASQKFFDQIDCVCDPRLEFKDVLAERMQIHGSKLIPYPGGDSPEKIEMFNKIIPDSAIFEAEEVEPLINIIKKHMKNKKFKIMLFGTGGDEMYNDHQDQRSGLVIGKSNGKWPESLEIIWPWYNYSNRLRRTVSRPDLICGYFGIEARNPLLDVNLVQAWLNTASDLKNSGYKSWMVKYLEEEKYPYSLKKVHWNEEEFFPKDWQKIPKDKFFAS